LDAVQIRAVLRGLVIGFRDIDYTKEEPTYRRELPYQKLLYAGIESGAGAMLGFKLAGPRAEGRHIIPFFGHTTNQDAWVPNAEVAYFHVGEDTRYVPSEAWVSSFIGHDDNFGSNFCVPRLYAQNRATESISFARRPTCLTPSNLVISAKPVGYFFSLARSGS